MIIRPIDVSDAENFLELSKKINEYYMYKLL